MFIQVYLPIGVFLIGLGIIIYKGIKNTDSDILGNFQSLLLVSFIIIPILALIINLFGTASPAKAIYADLENPVYLYKIPESQDKYLLLTEDLNRGGKYTYLFNKDGVPETDTILLQQARLIFDKPEKPYFAKVRVECSIDTFWLLWCNNTSPYTHEFHLPENSVLK